jgi:transposase-like protein
MSRNYWIVEFMRTTGHGKRDGSRREFWRELINQQARTGQQVRAFCSEHGVTEQSFYGWKKRLSGEAPVSFALVATDGSGGKQDAPLELDLGSGQRLRIPCGVDTATLRTVLAVLRERV